MIQSLQHTNDSSKSFVQMRGIVHYNRLRKTGNVVAVIALICFVATIALIGLSQAGYIHPASGLYAFSGFIGGLLILAVIHCCQKRVCKKYGIDEKACRDVYEPMPPKEEKKKKKQKSEE